IKVDVINETIVSAEDRENIIKFGSNNFRETSDGTIEVLNDKGKVKAIIDKDGYILNTRGQKLKFNIMASVDEEGNLQLNPYLNKGFKEILSLFDEETRTHILAAAKVVAMNDFISDLQVEKKMMKVLFNKEFTGFDKDSTMTTKNIGKLNLKGLKETIVKDIKSIRENELNYNDLEFNRLFRTRVSNGYRSAHRQETYFNITEKTDIAQRLRTMGNAGITSVILSQKSRKNINEETIRFIAEHGFDVILEVSSEDITTETDILEKYAQAGLSGVRVVVKNYTLGNVKILDDSITAINKLSFKTIPTISFDFSKDQGSKDKSAILDNDANRKEIVDYVSGHQIELVVDADIYLDENKKSDFDKLMNKAKVVLRVTSNVENKDANIVEVLKSIGVKICSKTFMVDNNVVRNAEKTPRYFGMQKDLEELFRDGNSVANIKEFLKGENISEEKIKEIFTEEVYKEYGKESNKLREFVIGAMIAEVDRNIIPENVRTTGSNYEILVSASLLMMVEGLSVTEINEKVKSAEINASGSVSQLLNNSALAKEVLSMWKYEAMTIKIENAAADTMTLEGLIKLILTIDTILPEKDLFGTSAISSLDGISAIMAAA
ncbi:MAG: hypothetical protein II816_02480, partial [Elusimicrobia bacterium]|nr:hypothetical protein [Elusimicrobiota bacterium]